MEWLLLHWPVGPALPPNSILQAIICWHQPLLTWGTTGPGSCQALHLAAGGQVHALLSSCLSCHIADISTSQAIQPPALGALMGSSVPATQSLLIVGLGCIAGLAGLQLHQ